MVLVGPSGSGKTTALRMLAGLEAITSGSVFIGDREVNRIAPRERDIAMVFQDYALYPQMTVFDNLAFGLRRRKVPQGGDLAARRRGRRAAGPRAAAGSPPGPALRRSGPAGRAGSRAGARAAGVPDGRAVEQPGREAAHPDPRRDPAPPAGGPHDHGLRHARPGRGDDDGRPDRGHERGRAGAGRDAGGALRAAGESVRGRLHRVAGDELLRGVRRRWSSARRGDRPVGQRRVACRPRSWSVSVPSTRVRGARG